MVWVVGYMSPYTISCEDASITLTRLQVLWKNWRLATGASPPPPSRLLLPPPLRLRPGVTKKSSPPLPLLRRPRPGDTMNGRLRLDVCAASCPLAEPGGGGGGVD